MPNKVNVEKKKSPPEGISGSATTSPPMCLKIGGIPLDKSVLQ